MIPPIAIQPIAAAEYDELLRHCTGCSSCRSVPERACPRAGVLRSQWSAARRAASSRRGGR